MAAMWVALPTRATWCPASARKPPKTLPTAPAPMTRIFIAFVPSTKPKPGGQPHLDIPGQPVRTILGDTWFVKPRGWLGRGEDATGGWGVVVWRCDGMGQGLLRRPPQAD